MSEVIVRRLEALAKSSLAANIRRMVVYSWYGQEEPIVLGRVKLPMLKGQGVLYERIRGRSSAYDDDYGWGIMEFLSSEEISQLQSWYHPTDRLIKRFGMVLNRFSGIVEIRDREEARRVVIHEDTTGIPTSMELEGGDSVSETDCGAPECSKFPFRLMMAAQFARLGSQLTDPAFPCLKQSTLNIPNGTWSTHDSGMPSSCTATHCVKFIKSCKSLAYLRLNQSVYFHDSYTGSWEEADDLSEVLTLLCSEDLQISHLVLVAQEIKARAIQGISYSLRRSLRKLNVDTLKVFGGQDELISLLCSFTELSQLEGAHVDLAGRPGCRLGGPVSDTLVGPQHTFGAQIGRAVQYLSAGPIEFWRLGDLRDLERWRRKLPRIYRPKYNALTRWSDSDSETEADYESESDMESENLSFKESGEEALAKACLNC